MTNGSILAVNVPNAVILFFDIATGINIGVQQSEHILMCYSSQKHKIFSIRSLRSNQVLYEVAFDNFLPPVSKQLKTTESFEQA